MYFFKYEALFKKIKRFKNGVYFIFKDLLTMKAEFLRENILKSCKKKIKNKKTKIIYKEKYSITNCYKHDYQFLIGGFILVYNSDWFIKDFHAD